MPFFRRSEWVLIAYYLFTALLSQVLDVRAEVRWVTPAINGLILGGLALLAWAHSLRRRPLLGILRDWYPFPLMLLAYREMGWFAPAEHVFYWERIWVQWDRMLLRDWGLQDLIESLGPVIPSVLEISYSLVYTMAVFGAAMLYAYKRRERMDRFLFTALLGVFISYALFPAFPSEPPRTVFPGEDFPRVLTIFRRFNWWLLGGYGIHTSVFPSAHVSGSFAAAFGMLRSLPEHRWVGVLQLLLASSIAVATVYGRYHYAVDAAAGFAVALAALGLSFVSFPGKADEEEAYKG